MMKTCCSLLLWMMYFALGSRDATGMKPQPIADTTTTDIAKIQNRYASSVLPTSSEQIERLHALSTKFAEGLRPDGKWPDIQYANRDHANWKASEHLERTLVMAKNSRLLHREGKPDSELDAKVVRALQAWTDPDYQNPNWWWNQIGVPELTGEIATLMQPELSKAEVAKVAEIMSRSEWRRGRWTGANLIWGVENEIVRGCLEGDSRAVKEGYDRMYQEIKIVSPTDEGIQQDYSFHQHGAQLYSGGYGLAYADDVGRFIAFSWGTDLQIPSDRMAIFSAYVLDGLQWMVRRDTIDYSVVGREITRAGKTIAPRDWTMGPISPPGPAYSLENVVDLLVAEPIPRQREFRSFAARLHGQKDAPDVTGNKQFWCSDFMVHRRRGFYTSIKMLSTRMHNGEWTNGEGLKSVHLSDGTNFLYMKGDEYRDIFPVWDWTKLPETTAIQGTLDTGEKNPIGTPGTTTFDGGVSDGTYGMAVLDLKRGNLTARKAWFFFDDSYLCLGTGIALSGDTEHSVATDVNQTLLRGPVFTSRSKRPVADGVYVLSGTRWVYHDHVGYIFAPGSSVKISIGPQTGRWSDIGSGSSQPLTIPVFDLWIDHGFSPAHGTYQYAVVPDATERETEQRAKEPEVRVLANTETIQAVWNKHLDIGMLAFRRAGALDTPAGHVIVDHSCLLMIRKNTDGWKLTASNPENQPLVLHVDMDGRTTTLDLPGGNFAGSSVASTLPITVAKDVPRQRLRHQLFLQ